MSSERRQNTRIPFEADITVRRGEKEVLARTQDLSIGGVKVLMPEGEPPLKSGERVSISFALPTLAKRIDRPAEVRWLGSDDGRVGGIMFLAGLRAGEVYAIEQMRKRAS